MITSRIRDIAITVVAVALLFFGGNFGLSCYKAKIIKDAEQAKAIDQGDAKIDSSTAVLRVRDSTVIKTETRYKDVERAATAAHPGDTTVRNLVRACQDNIDSCKKQRAAAQTLIDDQAAQIERLKKFSLPRFTLWAEAGYDALQKQPVVATCAEIRVVGALSATGCLEAERREPTPNDDSKVEARAKISGKLYIWR